MKKIFLIGIILFLSSFLLFHNISVAKENEELDERTYTEALVMENPILCIERNGTSAVYTYSSNCEIESKRVGSMQTLFHTENGVIKSITFNERKVEYIYAQFLEGLKCTGILWNDKEYRLEYSEYGNVAAIYDGDECVCTYDYSENNLLPSVNILQGEGGYNSDSSDFIGNVNPFRYQGWYLDTDVNCYYLGDGIFYNPISQAFIQNAYIVQDWGMEW